jgi:hypothetical protein
MIDAMIMGNTGSWQDPQGNTPTNIQVKPYPPTG